MPNINLTGVETTTNKSTSVNTDQASNTKYPSVKAVYDWVLGLFAPINNPTFTGSTTTPAIVVSAETASRVAIIDGIKNIKSADTSTYPSLTEFSYGKGVTSPIQTQLNNLTAILPNDISAWRKTGSDSFKRYYNNSITGLATATLTLGRNLIQYIPLVVSRTCTVAEVGMAITGAGDVGSVMRIGLYNSSNLLPTSLVFDAGTINGNSATSQIITLGTPTLLVPGLYFWAINHNSVATITVRAIALGSAQAIFGHDNTLGTAMGTFYTNTSSTYGVFASTAVAPTAIAALAVPSVSFYLSV